MVDIDMTLSTYMQSAARKVGKNDWVKTVDPESYRAHQRELQLLKGSRAACQGTGEGTVRDRRHRVRLGSQGSIDICCGCVLSQVQPFATVARQAPLSIEFSR